MNPTMAEHNGKESSRDPSSEQASLSGRMRDLILGQKVEERRMQRDGEAGRVKERRRRDDHAANSADGDI
jgi:hypothetical protein